MKPFEVISKLATLVGVALLVILAYDRFVRRDEAPAPHRASDPAVVKLGTQYGHALLNAASETLESTASNHWSTTSDAAQQNKEHFDEALLKAWKPVAGEITHRFGPVSDQPVDFAKGAEIRQFWRDLATGIKADEKP